MSLLHAIILGIVEGITEFLPISSTGHMIIASSIMGISHDEFTKTFTVAIQLGAILSVIVLYWKRFFQSMDFYIKLLIAFLPAAFFGFLFNKQIDKMLDSPLIVAVSLLLGGIILLMVDSWFRKTEMAEAPENVTITKGTALTIGFFQVIAMVPGVSRSAVTIIGGLTQKLNRKTAAEFSFFLAVPTMFAATGYKLFKYYKQLHEAGQKLTGHELKLLAVGNVIAFVVAMLAIRFFITYLTKHGFKLFGYYRILAGLLIIVLYIMGIKLEMI